MPMLRLAYARSRLPRRLRISEGPRPDVTNHADSEEVAQAQLAPLPEELFRFSSELLLQGVNTSVGPGCPQKRVFESAYLLLAAVATGDPKAGLQPPTEQLAVLGAAALHLPREDQKLAQALATVYGMAGWSDLDLHTMLEWGQVVEQCARRLGAASARKPGTANVEASYSPKGQEV